jgi:hypothetical protein
MWRRSPLWTFSTSFSSRTRFAFSK